jgi:flavin reductase (DIM6/NTAB) family NADH-FMN oxidoreductase RutF
MIVNFQNIEKVDVYRLLTHTVVPRPIAWVLTENDHGAYNVAPFSYFNVISSDPGILMFSAGHKRDGSKKDTWHNIEKRKRCVIHIADASLMLAVNESARSLADSESELDNIDVSVVSETGFDLPRIQQCPIAFDCDLHDIHLLGNGPQAVIYTQVKTAYVSDECKLSEQYTLDEQQLDPLARLGGERYSELGNITSIKRPG